MRNRREVPFARTVISDEAKAAALRVLSSGWVTTGPESAQFEEEFAHWVGAEHAVGVSSCTAGIELALRGLGLQPGDRVLVSSVTFCGAVHAIVHAGLVPVLVDVELLTGMPTPATTAQASRACGGAQAMLVVHLGGHPAPVTALAEAAGVPLDMVVEDAAHAVGTTVDGNPVGSISRATAFSFYATKNLPVGEGGMVTTQDPELADRMRRARLHGMSKDAWRRYLPGGSWRYTVDDVGLKANLTDLQAAIGRAQLAHLSDWQRRREELVARYDAHLGGVDALVTPAHPADGTHAWHLYAVQVQPWAPLSRDELIDRLSSLGIGTSVHFIPLHHMAHFRRVSVVQDGGLPGADQIFSRLLSLPLDQGLSAADVDDVCGVLLDVLATARTAEGI